MSTRIEHPISERPIFRRRGVRVLLLLLLVFVAIVAYLNLRSAHAYVPSANSKVWSADVKRALREAGAGGSVAPKGALQELPGVGKIKEVLVYTATQRKASEVLFLVGVNKHWGGLAYVDGYPLPYDACGAHLGGPWWDVTHLNELTSGCSRGYSFTGGP